MSFVFYDTETTGRNTCFDQVLQFGAIRTDHELRELDRFEIRCRLLPYVVPSAGAVLTHGLGVEQLTDPGLLSHYEMVRAIKAELEAWSPAIFIGHNSMAFDENLLRQAFYQTLHAPYLTNTNGNCRMDSLPILQAVDIFDPGILSVPLNEKNKPTYSLARLAPANGFAHDAAHDAIGDVEATLHLCRLLCERASVYWSSFVRFAQKAAVLDYTEAGEVFAFADFVYGKTYCRMVTAIGSNPEYGSEVFVFDLSHDPKELAVLSDNELSKRLATSPVPVRRLRANAGPCILPYEDVPTPVRMRMPSINDLRCRAAYIQGDEGFAKRLITTAMAKRKPKEPSVYVEEQIYNGFTDSEDEAIMAQFHEAPWSERAVFLERISDVRLQVLSKRLVYTEAPEVMPSQGLSSYQAEVARRLMAAEGTVPWTTLPQALRETDDFLSDSTGTETLLLKRLREYLVNRLEEAEAMMA